MGRPAHPALLAAPAARQGVPRGLEAIEEALAAVAETDDRAYEAGSTG
jgi:hypothetical protein